VKPFYEDKWVKIFHGDCCEILSSIDVKADLVVTSPPYNMRTRIRNGEYTEREWSDHFSKKYSEFRDAFPIDEYYEIHKEVLNQLLRLASIVFIDIQVVTGSKEAWFKIIGDFNRQLKDIVIWDKGEGQPAMHDAVINRSSELIMIFEAEATAGRAFTKSYFDRGTMPDIWRIGRGGNGNIGGHSALFPEGLVDRILTGWSLPNDLILDPFLGSGTTCYCAKKLNRYSIGIEISEKYCEIAAKRCMQEAFEFDLSAQPIEKQEELSL
jgi:site-specific DNA-methyltransferase (adenine-specific)